MNLYYDTSHAILPYLLLGTSVYTSKPSGVSTTIAYLNMTDKCLPPVHNEDELMMFAIYQEAERLGVM